MQEQTEQQKQMAKIKEYELSMEQMKLEGKRVDGEQKREYLKEEANKESPAAAAVILSQSEIMYRLIN